MFPPYALNYNLVWFEEIMAEEMWSFLFLLV